jgi:hypothetical protein
LLFSFPPNWREHTSWRRSDAIRSGDDQKAGETTEIAWSFVEFTSQSKSDFAESATTKVLVN